MAKNNKPVLVDMATREVLAEGLVSINKILSKALREDMKEEAVVVLDESGEPMIVGAKLKRRK